MFRNLSILLLSLIRHFSDIIREPRYPILCQFLEPINDDSPDVRKALAEFIREVCAYVECLRMW